MTDSEIVASGNGVLGIELGSTRIKAVLIAPDGRVLAQGTFQWENRFEDGYWTYGLDEAETGLRAAYVELAADVAAHYGCPLRRLAALVHCNNGSSDLDAWMRLFGEVVEVSGGRSEGLYSTFFRMALEGAADCGGIEVCNFVAAEPLAGVREGRPSVARRPNSDFTLANFMRASLNAVVSTLKIGLDTLRGCEGVRIDELVGHGGLFKTPGVMESIMSAVLGIPVKTLEIAGEGGAWGMASLACKILH